MSRINVLWVIDHVCYDGSLHGGGRLYWNVLPRFDPDRFRIVPCMLRATEEIRQVFANSPVPVRILDKSKFDPTTLWTFLRLLRKENIDVMHLHCYGASTFGRVAGLLTGVPAVIHDYDTEVYFPYPWYLGAADRLLGSMTRGAIAASPMVQEFLVRRRKIDPRKIRTMLHAIPREKYATVPRERVIRVRQSLGADGKTRVVATVTKLGPQRGHDFLLRSAAEVVKIFPDVLFVVVYQPIHFHRLPNRRYVQVSTVDGERMVAELAGAVKAMRLEENVRLIRSSDNVDELIAACDLIVAPFLSERFSSVPLLEAMARGKPVIATDMGEQREIVLDGVNGYLVTPGDVQELAARISDLLADPEKLGQMGREARQMSEQYSVDAYAQRLESVYTELAMNGKQSEPEMRKESP